MIVPSLNAVVIGAIPYSDSFKIVKVFTHEYGVVPMFVRLQKKGGANAIWHPLSFVEFTDVRKKDGGMATYKNVERVGKAIETLKDPKRTAVAFFIAEVMEKSLVEGAPLEEVYSVLVDGLEKLEDSGNVANLHFYVLARIVEAMGLMPEENTSGYSLHLETGEWHDASPMLSRTSYLLRNDLAQLMIKIPGMEFDTMGGLSLNQKDRKELLLAMVMFIQLHHAGLREIKSYEVLETIFS